MKKALGIGLLSGLMVLSVTPAFAASGDNTTPPTVSTGTEQQTATLQVHKDFKLPEGMTAVPNATFKFDVTQDSSNPAGTPNIAIGDISYSSTDSLSSSKNGNVYELNKNASVTLPAATSFPHAGEYTYDIKENNNGITGVTYSTENYKLRVYVANGNNGLYIKDITAAKGETKVNSIDFTNTYAKDSSLKISKNVAGDLGDRTKDFKFNLTLENNAFSSTKTYSGTIYESNGTSTGTTKTATVGEASTFNLKHGQYIKFDNLPVGTKYTVSETNYDGYTPTAKVNGEVVNVNSGAIDQEVVKEADQNTVAYTNTENSITVTGVVINNLPYILLAGLGAVGFAVLAVLKRRKLNQ